MHKMVYCNNVLILVTCGQGRLRFFLRRPKWKAGSKTAISFNILLVLLILYSQKHIYFQISNYIFIYIQSMHFPVITYGMALYINDSYVYRQNTNIEKIYVHVYASERSERA